MIAPWRGAAPNPMAARAARAAIAARAATEELGDFTTNKQQSPFLLSGFDQEIYFFFRVLRALGEHVELVTTRRRLHRVAAENRQLISAKGFRHPCIAQKTAVFSDLAEDFRQRERTVKLLQISHILFQIGSSRRLIRPNPVPEVPKPLVFAPFVNVTFQEISPARDDRNTTFAFLFKVGG